MFGEVVQCCQIFEDITRKYFFTFNSYLIGDSNIWEREEWDDSCEEGTHKARIIL